eukprot:SAG31_NODE_991_length_10522_cov_5.662862_7_plen_82_part_00
MLVRVSVHALALVRRVSLLFEQINHHWSEACATLVRKSGARASISYTTRETILERRRQLRRRRSGAKNVPTSNFPRKDVTT